MAVMLAARQGLGECLRAFLPENLPGTATGAKHGWTRAPRPQPSGWFRDN